MQKRIEDKLYVFDLVPFEITDGTDAEIIYVQYEHVAGYKKLNADIADKIAGFNQFIMAVNPPEWAKEQPTPPGPEPEVHTLGLTGDNWNEAITLVIDGSEQDISETSTWDVEEGSSIVIRPLEEYTCYEVTGAEYDSEDGSFKATMPAEDLTITINYTAPVETYTFTFQTNDSSAFDLTINGESKNPSDGSWNNVLKDEEIIITPKENPSSYSVEAPDGTYVAPDWDEGRHCWPITMPDHDIQVHIDYNSGESGNGES